MDVEKPEGGNKFMTSGVYGGFQSAEALEIREYRLAMLGNSSARLTSFTASS
jgi:hypothetical protein